MIEKPQVCTQHNSDLVLGLHLHFKFTEKANTSLLDIVHQDDFAVRPVPWCNLQCNMQ